MGSKVEIQIGAAKISKYATGESGDTMELIERPHGGLSFVLADGQRSGKAAKAISNLVARKAISLLAEGVRDGAAARAAHDYLYTHRSGKVSATLNIVSIDLSSGTIVLSRNSHCPAIVTDSEGLRVLDSPSQPIGIYRHTKPLITEIPIAAGTYVVVYTDGVLSAGERKGQSLGVIDLVGRLTGRDRGSAQYVADAILAAALELDEGRPADDTSVAVVAILPPEGEDDVRRLTARFQVRV